MRRAIALASLVAMVGVAASCRDEAPVIPTARSPLADSADQVMSGVEFLLTAGGVQQGKLQADSGFMFENSTRIELRGVRTDFFTKTGDQTGTLTSREGTYLKQRGDLEARKNVVVVSTDGRRRLTTEQLRYDEATDSISTDSAFVITQDGQVGSGVGFSTDPNFTRFSCKAACRGVFRITQSPSPRSVPSTAVGQPPQQPPPSSPPPAPSTAASP
jgi:LPS export ABC transporter protein LptC